MKVDVAVTHAQCYFAFALDLVNSPLPFSTSLPIRLDPNLFTPEERRGAFSIRPDDTLLPVLVDGAFRVEAAVFDGILDGEVLLGEDGIGGKEGSAVILEVEVVVGAVNDGLTLIIVVGLVPGIDAVSVVETAGAAFTTVVEVLGGTGGPKDL